MGFLDENFLLQNETARRLYREFAADQPILDFHNHLSPTDIAANRQFQNLSAAWLEEDHYKWRAMRANGIDEQFITGSATPYDKFAAWAETVPHTLRNPLYHWTHLELRRYFGIETLLDEKSSESIWEQTQQQLQNPDLSVHGILQKFDVRVVCTTDDPAETLDTHRAIADSNLPTKVFPTFRPDKSTRVDQPDVLNPWIDKLADVAGKTINDLDDLLDALRQRHQAFHEIGGRMSDHDLPRCFGNDSDHETASRIFAAARKGQAAGRFQFDQFGSFMMVFFGQLDAEKNWTKQMHIGAFRNTNTRRLSELGPDTGFDSVGDVTHGEALRSMLDRMEQADAFPKTILYNLNPADNFLFGTMIGNFQRDVPGKIQMGSGWWFLDQKEGIEWQLNALSNLGLLSRFIGMLTDSRSFLSFPRHEYFRRVLCNLLGRDLETGELPNNEQMVGELIRRICYQNAQDYLQFPG
jgi:glucuronate isomerase